MKTKTKLEEFDAIYDELEIIIRSGIEDSEKCKELVKFSEKIDRSDRGQIRTYLTAVKVYVTSLDKITESDSPAFTKAIETYIELAEIIGKGPDSQWNRFMSKT